MSDESAILSAMWQALKDEAACNPNEAIRIALLSEEAFKAAMRPFATELGDLRDGTRYKSTATNHRIDVKHS